MRKKLFVLATSTGVIAASLAAVILASKASSNKFEKVEANQIDLVSRLCGGSTNGNVRSFIKDDFEFKFEFQGVTFGADYIAIASGGYLRNITAINGLQSITFGSASDKLAVSAGKLTSNGIERYHFYGKDYDATKISDSYSFTSRASSHFTIKNIDDENSALINAMDLDYSCEGDIETPDLASLEGAYDNYTWDFLGGGSEETPFLIRNVAEWEKFTVTYQKNYTGFYFKLMSDISVTTAQTKNFIGHFDGNNHVITANISGDTDGFGLFCGLSGVGSVSNLILEGSVTSTNKNVGGIVGIMKDERNIVSNCINRASVSGAHDFGPGIGGVVGQSQGGLIENCINESSNIASTSGDAAGACIGGVLGSAYYTSKNYAVTVRNCKNFGSITSAKDDIGGVIGFANGSGSTAVLTLVVENCQNGDETHQPTITGNNHVGGVIGNAYQKCLQDYTQCYIKDCVNYGTVVSVASSNYKTGGIAGTSNIAVLDCDNYGNVTNSAGSASATDLLGGGKLGWIVGNHNTYCKNNSSGNVNHYSA